MEREGDTNSYIILCPDPRGRVSAPDTALPWVKGTWDSQGPSSVQTWLRLSQGESVWRSSRPSTTEPATFGCNAISELTIRGTQNKL